MAVRAQRPSKIAIAIRPVHYARGAISALGASLTPDPASGVSNDAGRARLIRHTPGGFARDRRVVCWHLARCESGAIVAHPDVVVSNLMPRALHRRHNRRAGATDTAGRPLALSRDRER